MAVVTATPAFAQQRSVGVTAHAGFQGTTASSDHSVAFTVTNTGTTARSYNVSAGCTGAAQSCGTPSPSSLALDNGNSATVIVGYTLHSTLDTGFVILHAVDAGDAAVKDTAWTHLKVGPAPSTGVTIARSHYIVPRSQCVTAAIGPNAAMECGDLRLTHAAPSVRTLGKERTPTLIYNSQFARIMPVVLADVTVPSSLPSQVEARVYVDGVERGYKSYAGSEWGSGGSTRRIAIPVDGAALAGTALRYSYVTVTFDGGSGGTYSTSSDLDFATVDRSGYGGVDGHFGAGWWLAGLERLYRVNNNTFLWVGGDGSTRSYIQSSAYTFTAHSFARPDSITQTLSDDFYRWAEDGSRIKFNWNGLHVATINRLGHVTRFTYVSGTSRLDSIIVPVKSGTAPFYKFSYDQNNILYSIMAPGNRELQLERSGSRIIWFRDPDTSLVQFSYASGSNSNRIDSRTDRLGFVTAFGYDANNRLTQSSLSLGASSIVTGLRPAEIVGVSTAQHVDSAYTRIDGPRGDVADVTKVWITKYGLVRRIRSADASETLLNYDDPNWHVESSTRSASALYTRASYNASSGLLESIQVHNPSGTSPGQVATTLYEWDTKWRRPTRVTRPEGDYVQFAYDTGNGNVQWRQPGASSTRRVDFRYDDTTKLVRASVAPGTTKDSVEYDALGNVSATRTPSRHWSVYRRDGLGRDTLVLSAVDPADTTRDGSDANRLRVSTQFDVTDRPLRIFTIGGSDTLKVRNSYDAEGNLTAVSRRSDPDHNGIDSILTRYRYDGASRMVAEQAPDTLVLVDSTVYDPAGNAILVKTRNGSWLEMVYDALNRLTRRVTPARSVPSETIEGESFPQYTASIPADTAVFVYDVTGLVAANNGDARIERVYNPNGTARSETQRIRTYYGTDFNAHVYTLRWYYDLNGRRSALAAGDSISYGYSTSTGDLTSVTGGGATFTFAYDDAGRLAKQTSPGQVTDTNYYDSAGRLERRVEAGENYSRPLGGGYTSTLHDERLRYDGRGKVITTITQRDSIETRYSKLGAVDSTVRHEVGGPVQREMVYTDAFANMIERTFPSSDVHEYKYQKYTGRLVRSDFGSTQAFTTYDSAGNAKIALRNEAVGQYLLQVVTRSYYGADNKLRIFNAQPKGTPPNGARPDQLWTFDEYRYDALGRRVLMRSRRNDCNICQSAIERYIWDGDDLIKETRYQGHDGIELDTLEQDSGAVSELISYGPITPPDTVRMYSPHYGVTRYVHGGVIDRPLLAMRAYFGQDSFYVGEVSSVLHYDWRGVVDEGTGLGGGAVGSTGIRVDWPGADVLLFGNRWLNGAARSWFGGLIDGMRDASGLQYRRNRYYDPTTGRFTQEDPIGLAGGMNLYGFAGGDPVNFSDPMGLCPEWKDGIPCVGPVSSPMVAAGSPEPSGAGGSEYGFTRSGGTQFHNGFDWAASSGTAVVAPGDATVTAMYDKTSGNYVQMDLGNGTRVSVLHMSGFADGLSVGKSMKVKAGATVGTTGRTGNAANSPREAHGHVITRVNGKTCNPRDFLSKDGGGGSCQ